MNSHLLSHRGKRKDNQDVILSKRLNEDTFLYLIADGMGGYDNGKLAAEMVVESISTFLSTVTLFNEISVQKSINKANLIIRQYQEKHQSKLGATIGGIIVQGNKAKIFWVGDVKIFHFRKNKLQYESNSHNLLNEIKNNESVSALKNAAKYSHIVTRSIHGVLEKSHISYLELVYNEGDIFMICSDGVHDIIDGQSIAYLLNQELNFLDFISKINKRLKEEASDNASTIFITHV